MNLLTASHHHDVECPVCGTIFECDGCGGLQQFAWCQECIEASEKEVA